MSTSLYTHTHTLTINLEWSWSYTYGDWLLFERPWLCSWQSWRLDGTQAQAQGTSQHWTKGMSLYTHSIVHSYSSVVDIPFHGLVCVSQPIKLPVAGLIEHWFNIKMWWFYIMYGAAYFSLMGSSESVKSSIHAVPWKEIAYPSRLV